MSKHDKGLRIDRRVEPNFALGDLPTADYVVDDLAHPAPPTIPAPINLVLSATLSRSAQAGMALLSATWDFETLGFKADSFLVQVSTDSTFATGSQAYTALQESAALENLKVATTYYVRVQAVYQGTSGAWSATASVTTPTDLTPPAAVTGVSWQWLGNGDLAVSWTAPTSENYKDAEMRVWTSSLKTTLLRAMWGRNGAVYTAAMNYQDTGNVPLSSVYIEVLSRSWTNVYGPVAVPTGLITKAAPATPGTIAQSWSGDTGAAGADWTISWAAQSDAAYYLLNINALGARRVYGNTYTYTLDKNIADNAGADPSLSYSLIAVDGLNQSSTAASGTATNAAPAAPTVALAGGAMSLLVATVTTAPAADFAAWEFVWKRDGSTVRTLESKAAEQQYELGAAGDSGAHSWTVVVRQKDLFGQYSTATTSSAVVLDTLTIDYLRAGLSYSDSDGNTFTPPSSGTLAALKDGVTVSGGVTYAA